MINLVSAESRGEAQLMLRFSDGAWGIYDFSPFIEANTVMTAPLAEHAFFARHFIEAGALAWPNGFDLSVQSLYRRLEAAGELHHSAAAA